MNRIKKKVVATKDFVAKHRVAIAVVGTSIVWIKIMATAAEQHNEFLKEHGLYEKFYDTGEE